MFELQRIKLPVSEFFLKVFKNHFKEKELIEKFIFEWLTALDEYSKLPNFIRFDSKIPILNRLNSKAKSLLIVPFDNVKVHYMKNVSILPLYPFRAQLTSRSICYNNGVKFILLYLKITKIMYVGFYKISNHKKICNQIKEFNSKIKCYPPTCFKYFCERNKVINGYI